MSGRERGYRFENRLAKRYNRHGWKAWRLGASSIGLPDILAVGAAAINVHELKTTIGGSVNIPTNQIARCVEVAAAFERYEGRVILSAFFANRAEYHYLWLGGEPEPVTINKHGKTSGGEVLPRTWEDLLAGGGVGSG